MILHHMALLAVLVLLVSCSSMYSPLPDIEQGAGPDEITIAIQYLPVNVFFLWHYSMRSSSCHELGLWLAPSSNWNTLDVAAVEFRHSLQ